MSTPENRNAASGPERAAEVIGELLYKSPRQAACDRNSACWFEYGVLRVRPREEDTPHRDGMTVEEAGQWLAEWVEMGGKPDTFSIIRREVGPWEKP